MQLRVELDRKIEYVNNKIFHLLEQYSHSQPLPTPLSLLSQTHILSTPLSQTHIVVAEVQTQTPSQIVSMISCNNDDDINISMNNNVHDNNQSTKQLLDNLEQNRYLHRIAELESVNSHLIEHNVELVRSSIDENKLKYLHNKQVYNNNNSSLVDISSSVEEKQQQQQQYSEEQMKTSPLVYSQQLKFLENQVIKNI